MKNLYLFVLLIVITLLTACSAKPIFLDSQNYNEVMNNMDKYKDKQVEYQGTVTFTSKDKKSFTVFVGSAPQSVTEVTSKTDINAQEFSNIKVTGKILGKKDTGLINSIIIDANKIEVLDKFYNITGLASDNIAIKNENYKDLISNLDNHIDKMAELNGKIVGKSESKDNLYTYSLEVTGFISPTIKIVSEKPIEMNPKDPTMVKVRGVIKKYPVINNTPVIIATNIEIPIKIVEVVEATEATVEAAKATEAPIEATEEPVKATPTPTEAPVKPTQAPSITWATKILKREFPEYTFKYIPKNNIVNDQNQHFYYFTMKSIEKSAMAFTEMYVCKEDKALYINASPDGSNTIELITLLEAGSVKADE